MIGILQEIIDGLNNAIQILAVVKLKVQTTLASKAVASRQATPKQSVMNLLPSLQKGQRSEHKMQTG